MTYHTHAPNIPSAEEGDVCEQTPLTASHLEVKWHIRREPCSEGLRKANMRQIIKVCLCKHRNKTYAEKVTVVLDYKISSLKAWSKQERR